MDETLFTAAGGSDGLVALAHAWHERCLADPVVSHAFSHPGQHPQHTERLAAYWVEALGGPAAYTDGLGATHSHVLRLHSGNGEHDDMDRRAVDCFVAAMDDVGLPGDVRRPLLEWWTAMVAVMSSHPDSADDVPDGLPLPRWTRDGPTG
ncbi:oxidoreductase [Nocardioides currus]|uniref:Oxidoreductase n=1 Tax=Nocardioides currus TaxID=2133958 RepID=A0A2R7YSL5_9ACTN|nr:oxidoreductase [Nocardioides currus]PUA79397.1 oxidoreductase [Nocardioides currus]